MARFISQGSTMDEMRDFPTLDEIVRDLHRSEINGGLSWAFDGVWRVTLGDRLNGYEAGATVRSLEEAAEWLVENAFRVYPESGFARNYRTFLPDDFLERLEAVEASAETEVPDESAIAEDDAADLAIIDGVESSDKYVEILLAQGPGPESDFIEAVNSQGRAIGYGKWRQRSDGTWVLRVPFAPPEQNGETEVGFV
jgi:hypothetical protein